MRGSGTRKGLLGRCSVSVSLPVGEACRKVEQEWGVLVLLSQWFAPTHLVLSFETEGHGKFTPEELEALVERDKQGNVTALNLPRKTVLIANHQVRHSMLNPRSLERAGEHASAIDLRRLVVCMDAHVPRGHPQGRVYRPQEEPQVGPDCRLGVLHSPIYTVPQVAH